MIVDYKFLALLSVAITGMCVFAHFEAREHLLLTQTCFILPGVLLHWNRQSGRHRIT